MKKIILKENSYYFGVISIIGILLLYNIYVTILSMKIIGFLPIALQAILLVLLISKNEFSILAVKIWSAIFLIGAAGLKIFGIALQGIGKSLKDGDGIDLITSNEMIYALILLIIGIIVFILAKGMGKIGEIEN